MSIRVREIRVWGARYRACGTALAEHATVEDCYGVAKIRAEELLGEELGDSA